MGAVAKESAAAAIGEKIMNLHAFTRARCIAAFAAMEEEVNIWPLIRHCWATGKTVALPRLAGPRQLTFHAVTATQSLQKSDKNILQPLAEVPIISPKLFDFAFIPAVAVDNAFFRLGYGGGFYDTFMPLLDGTAVTCTPLFCCQRVAHVPRQSHDARVDIVFSE